MVSPLELLFVAGLVVVAVLFVTNLRPNQGNSEIVHVLITPHEQRKGPGCLPVFLLALLLLPPSVALIRLGMLLSPGIVLLIGG
jgi:hypothetical protein